MTRILTKKNILSNRDKMKSNKKEKEMKKTSIIVVLAAMAIVMAAVLMAQESKSPMELESKLRFNVPDDASASYFVTQEEAIKMTDQEFRQLTMLYLVLINLDNNRMAMFDTIQFEFAGRSYGFNRAETLHRLYIEFLPAWILDK